MAAIGADPCLEPAAVYYMDELRELWMKCRLPTEDIQIRNFQLFNYGYEFPEIGNRDIIDQRQAAIKTKGALIIASECWVKLDGFRFDCAINTGHSTSCWRGMLRSLSNQAHK